MSEKKVWAATPEAKERLEKSGVPVNEPWNCAKMKRARAMAAAAHAELQKEAAERKKPPLADKKSMSQDIEEKEE